MQIQPMNCPGHRQTGLFLLSCFLPDSVGAPINLSADCRSLVANARADQKQVPNTLLMSAGNASDEEEQASLSTHCGHRIRYKMAVRMI